ncbi:peptidoglycan bridge formation glycyltransferase FemA/FemB family protein [Candidatus Saccharibacteria bacterium]|nr:peptidoglycan bridge formation glycyltransferase FemA/FemB family protein [Candidatus Saccharibacteria bacterium]
MKIPITQSEKWQKLQDDLGEKSYFEASPDFQYLAIKKHTPIGNYLYLPYGPVSDTSSGFKKAIKSLEGLAKATSAIFIRIEPRMVKEAEILALGGKKEQGIKAVKKSKDMSPKETWLLDLTGTDDDLKAKLPSRLLRYYRNREKQGITIETSRSPEDIHYLLDLQKSLAREKGISTFSEAYLKTELSQPFATLYIVRQNNKVLAAGLVFDDDTTRYNLQGAQSDEGRKLHATGILTIQLILDAKAKGQQIFDFWGIAPDGAPANHPWAGFTAFKKTFLGYEATFAGTHDLVLNPTKYRLYSLLRKLRYLAHN